MCILPSSDQMNQGKKKINQDYTEIILDQSLVGRYGVEVHLGAANHILNEFLSLQNVIQKTSTPKSLQELIFGAVEEYIQPRIVDYYQTIDENLTPGDAAKIATWIDNFLNVMRDLCPGLQIVESWKQDREKLVEHYLQLGVFQEMKELLERSLQLFYRKDLRQDRNGHMVMGLPGQIAYMFEQELSVASEICHLSTMSECWRLATWKSQTGWVI